MFSKIANTDKLHFTFLFMSFINFIIIIFIGSVMAITIQTVCDMDSAYIFLSRISHLPKNPYSVLLISILAFLFLLVMMWIRRKQEITSVRLGVWFAVEIVLCMIIMEELSFSTNAILLFVMADILLYLTSNVNRMIYMLCMIVLYLICNYEVMSRYVSMLSFMEYISVYDASMRAALSSALTTLSSLNIIVFIVHMIFVVQDKLKENKHFIEMNNELKNLNEQLKEYADIREKMGETRERNRLAREIHDTLGHTLTGLSVGLDACVVTSDIDLEATKKQLRLLSETARRGLKDVRRSVDKLRPDALEHYTLKEALDKMIQEFHEVTDVSIHFVCHLPKLVFDNDEEEVIYRIIQEGMTNAVRHGKAKEIYISIAKERNILILIIEDDGIGCENIKPDFGLHHMQERVSLLQGNIRFYGSNGFVIIAEIPIREGVL